jgi:hypothetical protein
MKQKSTHTKSLSGKRTITALLSVILLMITLVIQAQAVKEYTWNEADALKTDLNAGTYDIYVLSSPSTDGDYVISGTTNSIIILNKNVIIRAKEGLTVKPRVAISGTSTSSTAALLIPSVPSMILTLDGIEFDGLNRASSTLIHQLVRSATGSGIIATTASQDFKLIVRNCYFHDFGDVSSKGVFRMEGIGSSVDIQTSVFNNCLGRIICLQSVAVDPYIQYGDIILKDNTFSNIPNDGASGNGIITFRSASSGTQLAKGNNLTIDHCTFYNCKSYSATTPVTDIFTLRTMKGLISITNCIFDQVSNGFSFVNPDLTAPAPVIDFNYLAGFAVPPAGTNTLTTAPVYTDAATLKFGLTNRAQLVGGDGLTAGNTIYYGLPTAISNQLQVTGKDNCNFRIYPNPGSANVNFDYSMVKEARVSIIIYNLNNQVVKTCVNNEVNGAGRFTKSYDISGLAPGVYFARLTSGSSSKTVKMVVRR